jgi:hypothetical protein
MGLRCETLGFGLVLAGCLSAFFCETLLGGRILSPADVLLVEASFRREAATDDEPLNRLLMDPVLQFQPWLEFNRTMIRQGRLPLWNPYAGCGAPHLANGQSAVFDPFCLVAYLWPSPQSLAWTAAGRLWIAGLGMFLLAHNWGLALCGRWFAGLVYPFCGFLIVWLLYPITPVAIWLPWLLLATGYALEKPGSRSVGLVALAVGLVIAGGHIQTSAHVLLASGLFALWRTFLAEAPHKGHPRGFLAWGTGIAVGLLLGAAQIIPLGSYLAKSPVWGDRQREGRAWWSLARPRLLDAVCTAMPYAYGSQRRGHPNLARGLGVYNINESAGGYAGLATLIWLAPLGVRSRRRVLEVRFLTGLVLVGALGAFRFPPVDNLLRALPVLEVTDNRRLVLWVAFGLTLLGGFGLDALARGELTPRPWVGSWLLAALILGAIAVSTHAFESGLRDRVDRHYQQAARSTPGSDPALYQARGERQVRAALDFVPRYYGRTACELLLLAGLAVACICGRSASRWVVPTLLVSTMAELACFGFGLNPAIPTEIQHFEPPLIRRLRGGLAPGQRALGIGEELPPNVLMRFGLNDPRNYDSVELERSLRWFAPLFEPGERAQTSRRQVTWEGVLRARERLREAAVGAIVAATAPPPDQFPRVEQLGDVWIAWLDPQGWVNSESGATHLTVERGPNTVSMSARAAGADLIIIRDTWDPGWKAYIDGRATAVAKHRDTFMAVSIPAGDHIIELKYQPVEVLYGLVGSSLGFVTAILALTELGRFLIPGIRETGLGRT